MPVVTFAKNHAPIQAEVGDNLMKRLTDSGIPVASSCAGDGVCLKCKVTVLEGADHLSPLSDQESFHKSNFAIPKSDRLSCQVRILGDIKIDTTYW